VTIPLIAALSSHRPSIWSFGEFLMFKGVGMRAAALRAMGAALSVVLLASCGGGGQVEKYQPSRIVSFGDETSMIVDGSDPTVDLTGVVGVSLQNGAKYTVNAIKDKATNAGATLLDCKLNSIWNQYVATAYGLVFPQCNPDGFPTTSRIFATKGATVAAVKTQIDTFLAQPDTFTSATLVTILAGQYDVRAQYDLVKAGTITEAQAQANIEQAGTDLATQVNRVGQAGGKVLIATIWDVGTTPFGLAEDLASPGRAALLSLLSSRFNSKLRIGIINDGKMIGLVLADEVISSAVKNPGVTFVDVQKPACDPVKAPLVLQCTTDTLASTSTVTVTGDTNVWADDLHLSSGAHRAVGSLAVTRATGNPF
jgi:outer membrane lipase/esterase